MKSAGCTSKAPISESFGALSDRLGRRPIMIIGLILGGLTLIPSFHALVHFANPELASFSNRNPIVLACKTML